MLKITSPAFENHAEIPKKYTCYGENISPPLNISNVPDGAQSFVLIMQNLSSPKGRWINWLVWNLEAAHTFIPENSNLEWSTIGLNSYKEYGYSGPCPSNQKHEFQIMVFALKDMLILDKEASIDELIFAMEDYVLTQGEITFYSCAS